MKAEDVLRASGDGAIETLPSGGTPAHPDLRLLTEQGWAEWYAARWFREQLRRWPRGEPTTYIMSWRGDTAICPQDDFILLTGITDAETWAGHVAWSELPYPYYDRQVHDGARTPRPGPQRPARPDPPDRDHLLGRSR